MILTHLVFHEFFSGASTSGESDSIGGSLSLPPYFLFDGFSEVGASNDTFGSTLTLPPYYLFNGFSDASAVVPPVTPAPEPSGGGTGAGTWQRIQPEPRRRHLRDEPSKVGFRDYRQTVDEQTPPEAVEVIDAKAQANELAQRIIAHRREISRIKTQMRLSSNAQALKVMEAEIEAIEKHIQQDKREAEDFLLLTIIM